MYDFYSEQLTDNVTVHFLDIYTINSDFEELITSSIQQICGGRNTEDSLIYFKKRLADFFSNKLKNDKIARGAIAEFIIHLHLNSQSYSQECMFFNLEELSIKKGFDGYYSKDDEQWIMESKSTKNKKKSHTTKIKEAYQDLKNKIETKTSNDPWRNAYNHMRNHNVNTKQSIYSIVHEFSNSFQNGEYQKISDFNIIPCSTLYLERTWTPINKNDLENKLLKLSADIEGKKIHMICINSKLYKEFIELITK